ncbi:hypothetical protein LPJ53_004020 [Coemansia erecta]|uniref:K Homology domain-containing protein n=1 Tax=Coemansia erecta TaxID=147472 RepID=A0A9W7XYQ2_9FUNG|nr:hypothetical protein LPJ53_004020 [Coemansia erecta]
MPPKRKTRASAKPEHADEDQAAAAVEPQYDQAEEAHDDEQGRGQEHAGSEYQQADEERSVLPPAQSAQNDALTRARLIAAKLGPIANPEPQAQMLHGSPVVIPSDSPPYEPADERTPSPGPGPVVDAVPMRTRDRRSASPDRQAGHQQQQGRGYKRGRSNSRERPQHATRARRDNGGGPRERQPQQQQQQQPAVEFRVPADMVGLIIGRQGSNLKAVEQRHGVRVATAQDYDRRDPERTISIEGPVENAENARDEILDFVARNADRSSSLSSSQQQQQQQGRPGFRRPQGQSLDGPQSPVFGLDRGPGSPTGGGGGGSSGGGMVTVSVPSAKVGLIIGRGGESIREIQRVSGARVQVEPDDGCGAPDRVVRVSGAPEQIESARARIMEIVSPERSMRDASFGHHHQQQQFGDRGPRHQQHQQHGYGGPPPSQQQQQQPPMYGGQPGMPEQHGEEMQVPAEAVGLIIGRGGENIKMIQQTTGARVNIIQDQDRSAPFRPVTISGDHAACMQARQMIEEKIASIQQRQSGGGYGGGRSGNFGPGPGRGGHHHQQQQQHHQQRQMGYGQPSGGYGGPQQYHQQQQQQQPPYQPAGDVTSPGGYAPYGGYAGSEQQHQQMPQPQQQPYGQGASAGAVAGGAGEQSFQWTNQQTADYYAQYASTSPEYAQYAEYYRKLAEKDPHGIVPSSG